MDTRPPVVRALQFGLVALLCLALLAGCVDRSRSTDTPTGPDMGVPVTDYETLVFDLAPSSDPLIEGGIAFDDEGDEQYYVTLLASAAETDRFNHSLLPSDAGEFVDTVSFEDESLVVIQAFPASSVPDYRVESVTRDGPTLHVSINDSSAGGTDDVTVETVFVRVPGATPDNVIVTTQEGRTFEIAAATDPEEATERALQGREWRTAESEGWTHKSSRTPALVAGALARLPQFTGVNQMTPACCTHPLYSARHS